MAKAHQNPSALFFASILMFSLLLIISLAESRMILGVKPHAAAAFGTLARTPECDEVTGVKGGDTCFAIAQKFNLTTEFFDSINPNLNCTALFIGQWLCVDGST